MANVMLDPLDKELENRGHKFARYADDFTILVRSDHAGERVLKTPGINQALSNAYLKSEGLYVLRGGWIKLHYSE